MAFGKLGNLASGAITQKVADQLTPVLTEQIQKLPAFGASKLKDEEFFGNYVVKPCWLAVEAATSGLTKLYPPLQQKFGALMRHLRDELLIFEGESVSLVDDLPHRVPAAILSGLNQA